MNCTIIGIAYQDISWLPDSCASACESHPDCFRWTRHLQNGGFVRSFRLGRPRVLGSEEREEIEASPEDIRFAAGWATERIRNLIEKHPCNEVQWVRPRGYSSRDSRRLSEDAMHVCSLRSFLSHPSIKIPDLTSHPPLPEHCVWPADSHHPVH